VEQVGDNAYKVVINPSLLQGIVDGGHTYRIISEHVEAGDLPDNQFVEVNVRVGVPFDWHPFIAGGLNTGIQVPPVNLKNLQGAFVHLKEQLRTYGLADKIAWKTEDEGIPVRDLLSLLLMFNIQIYPKDQPNYPIEAYSGKAQVLKRFVDNPETFKRMPAQFVYEILCLHDFICTTAESIWNEGSGRFGALELSEYLNPTKPRYKPIEYPFTGGQSDYGLVAGAIYPILGAFRWLVDYDKALNMGWRITFDEVKQTWMSVGREMLIITQDNSTNLSRNPNALGKNRPQWSQMFNIVKAARP